MNFPDKSPSNVKIKTISYFQDYLEKTLMGLPSEQSQEDHRIYMAGVIETLFDFGAFPVEIRDEFYLLYAY